MVGDAANLVRGTSAILLDFDGPVCSVFAGLPAASVAEDLRVLASHAADIADESDPLEVLRKVSKSSHAAAVMAEDVLAAAELKAIALAAPTDGADDLLRYAHRRKIPVAIVSNNSEAAIRAYLAKRNLSHLIAMISARSPTSPDLMKPHPRSLEIAIHGLAVAPARTLMIGDSMADIAAARAINIKIIALANRAHKASQFAKAGADCIVTTMRELTRFQS
ncbi:HAD family hydrolase [Kineosporia sp. A_224]|uniref:HAD family hydrolase n=1 Tax=Kineosporia sp. A_224 TaxID=1962180 RepID=UPI000B4BCD57|nr:HAD-IA family hydrolase [Kineosporia sp. A_224]